VPLWSVLQRRRPHEEESEYDEYEDEEWEEGDEWEEDEDQWDDDDEEEGVDWSEAWDEDGDGEISAREFSTTVSFGVLSMLPLLLGYEWALGQAASGLESTRSIAEAILSTPLRPLGTDSATLVRRSLLLAVAFWGLVGSFRHHVPVVPRLVRVLAEGALGAILLGPILAMTAEAAAPFVGTMMTGGVAGVPQLQRAAFVMGGAAFEEIVFRVLAVALAFLVLRQGAAWFGFGRRLSGLLAAIGATGVSAFLFAAFHTEIATAWLGFGGEAYDPALFTWRAASGVLLTVIVFWRGVGVAAWSHAFFNLALLIGVTPPSLF
jgi:hypothetical protein